MRRFNITAAGPGDAATQSPLPNRAPTQVSENAVDRRRRLEREADERPAQEERLFNWLTGGPGGAVSSKSLSALAAIGPAQVLTY
jgi:hypothetical protein